MIRGRTISIELAVSWDGIAVRLREGDQAPVLVATDHGQCTSASFYYNNADVFMEAFALAIRENQSLEQMAETMRAEIEKAHEDGDVTLPELVSFPDGSPLAEALPVDLSGI